jgi:hypothetical protein
MKPTKNTVKIPHFGTEITSEHLTLAIGIPLNQLRLFVRFGGTKIDPHSLGLIMVASQANRQGAGTPHILITTNKQLALWASHSIWLCKRSSVYFLPWFLSVIPTGVAWRTYEQATATNTNWTLAAWGELLFLKDQNILSSLQCHYF